MQPAVLSLVVVGLTGAENVFGVVGVTAAIVVPRWTVIIWPVMEGARASNFATRLYDLGCGSYWKHSTIRSMNFVAISIAVKASASGSTASGPIS